MQQAMLQISKRDGSKETFKGSKIYDAMFKAFKATGIETPEQELNQVVAQVEALAKNNKEEEISVENIQDIVEAELMKINSSVAKKYIIYREQRNKERHKRTKLKHIMDGIVRIEKNDINLSNANMSAYTPSGQMMTFAAEVTKDYALKYLLAPNYAEAHKNGDIHIHDLDYYPTKTATCVQYDLEDLFERGFRTKNGSIRTPQSIQSYATLATIVFQTNQNEQHGGQAIPAFDFFMAPGVKKTFRKHLCEKLTFAYTMETEDLSKEAEAKLRSELKALMSDLEPKLCECPDEAKRIADFLNKKSIKLSENLVLRVLKSAYKATEKDTHQAMEGFIHNLNTMHSRGGNQVVFSSINYGTDTSNEGRMVMRELLKATVEGLGKNEVPIFPIQIFKVKEGVNYSEADYKLAMEDIDAALAGKVKFTTPNFDLLLESCKTTSSALFPNFVFLDTKFNQNDAWKADDPKRYLHEIATMGCRTRVFENLHGIKSSVGRGNLSFTTMNLPRLALLAKQDATAELGNSASEEAIREKAIELFYKSIRSTAEMISEQLYERYLYQRSALAKQFPFLMNNDVWKGGKNLGPNDEIGDVWNSGSLGVGFIGGHNAMVALYGQGHGSNQEAHDTLYKAILVMNDVVNEYKKKYNLNYSVLATPAEGLSGRFTRMDRARFGSIEGVTDLEYYVNSFHVDVKENISMFDKIKREAPFHAITSGGHISYIELDGEAKKNVGVILKLVRTMKEEGIGYGSINHPVDTCNACNYRGMIYDKCPVCSSENIARLRRITGYLTGTLDSWNSAKQAEERDRVKHS